MHAEMCATEVFDSFNFSDPFHWDCYWTVSKRIGTIVCAYLIPNLGFKLLTWRVKRDNKILGFSSNHRMTCHSQLPSLSFKLKLQKRFKLSNIIIALQISEAIFNTNYFWKQLLVIVKTLRGFHQFVS